MGRGERVTRGVAVESRGGKSEGEGKQRLSQHRLDLDFATFRSNQLAVQH
jgi:hypothetical protein